MYPKPGSMLLTCVSCMRVSHNSLANTPYAFVPACLPQAHKCKHSSSGSACAHGKATQHALATTSLPPYAPLPPAHLCSLHGFREPVTVLFRSWASALGSFQANLKPHTHIHFNTGIPVGGCCAMLGIGRCLWDVLQSGMGVCVWGGGDIMVSKRACSAQVRSARHAVETSSLKQPSKLCT